MTDAMCVAVSDRRDNSCKDRSGEVVIDAPQVVNWNAVQEIKKIDATPFGDKVQVLSSMNNLLEHEDAWVRKLSQAFHLGDNAVEGREVRDAPFRDHLDRELDIGLVDMMA
mmetsp:Transcript_34284/g.79251  ORF Transcript_34284/g.79251 Transcript_34284/m.79251 type:complete len:111 (+) Transcript_34284:228-560(+)